MEAEGGRLQHYCVSCGTVVEKQTNRRKLQGSASEAVVNILKKLCHEIEETSDIDADAWWSLAKEGKMCRKCFHAYERYHSLHGVLLDNLKIHQIPP